MIPRVRTEDYSAAGVAAAYRRVEAAATEGAMAIETDGKLNAPVKTGNLRRSIVTLRRPAPSLVIRFVIGPQADYGIHQEIGTARMPGKFYMTRASITHEARIKAGIKDAVAAGLREGLPR